MSFTPFIIAAKMLKKYNSDCWWGERVPCPIISEQDYLNLKPSDHTIADLFIHQYDKVRGHPYDSPKVLKLLQVLVVMEDL